MHGRLTSAALALVAAFSAFASEPMIDSLDIRTRAPKNPLVKVWYRVPKDYDPQRSLRCRVLVLFGGRNGDGRPEVSGKLGWTEWADLNGIFLVAPSFSKGEYWNPENGSAAVVVSAVDSLRAKHALRPFPVFLFGYSAGGQLVALL